MLRADWHQNERAQPVVGQYQTTLDSVLQIHPELLGCVTHCVDCGIRFLTHPRNAGRRDLRCPFGCRRHHRRQCSCQRSTAYYRTATGKRKKKRLNGRRQRVPPITRPVPDPQPAPPSAPDDARPVELSLEGVTLDESSLSESPMLPYVRMVVSLIEGVDFRCGDVLDLLRRAMRQHSIATDSRIDYALGFLHQHPP